MLEATVKNLFAMMREPPEVFHPWPKPVASFINLCARHLSTSVGHKRFCSYWSTINLCQNKNGPLIWV